MASTMQASSHPAQLAAVGQHAGAESPERPRCAPHNASLEVPAGEQLEVSVIRMSYSMVLKVQDTAWRSPIAALKARYDLERFCPQATVCLGTKTDELPSSTF